MDRKFYLLVLLANAFTFYLSAQKSKSINSYQQDYVSAQEFIAAENHEKALDFLNSSISKKPDFIEAYFLRATVKEFLNDLESALNDYNMVIGLSPNYTEAIFSRGLIRYQLKHYTSALNDFQILLSTPSGETQAIYFRKPMFKNTADKIVSLQSGNRPAIYNHIGLTYTALMKYDSAIIYYDSAIYRQPTEADYYVNRGIAKIKKELIHDATEDFSQALALEPTHSLAQYNLAILSLDTYSDNQRIEIFTNIIKNDSTIIYAYTSRGNARLNIGDFNGALKDYDVAIKLDNNNIDNWLNRGLAKIKLNDLSGAYQDFSKAIALKPTHEKALLNLGNVLYKMKNYKEAVDSYSLTVLYYPKNSNAYYNRALANYNNGNKDDACQDLKIAKKLGFLVAQRIVTSICSNHN